MLASLALCAQARAETTVSLGYDPFHGTGVYAEARMTSGPWSAYAGDWQSRVHLGGDGELGRWHGVGLHLGVALAQPDAVVGTALRYAVRVDYPLTRHTVLQLVHESNCASLCREVPGGELLPHGSRGKPNSGNNALTVGYRF